MIGIPVALMAVSLSGAPGGPAEARELAAAVVAVQSRLERLLFDSVCIDRAGQGSATVTRSVEALGDRHHFFDVIHLASPDALPWLDPVRRQVWVRPEGAVELDVFGRNVRSHDPGRAGAPRGSPYPEVIGWRPPGGSALSHPSGEGPSPLIDVFAAGRVGSLEVSFGREPVAGLSCQVVSVDGDRERIWLCPDYGYALTRRIIRLGGRAGGEAEYRARDFQQVGSGLWLPRVCEGEVRPAGGRPPSRAFTIRVTHLSVNADVPDTAFRPKLPPGAVVFAKTGRLEAMIPGGTDLLDHWAATAVTLAPPSGIGFVPWTTNVLVILLGASLLGLGWWLASRAQAPRGSGREADAAEPVPLVAGSVSPVDPG